MARRRTVSIGPPDMGLTDFPEHAGPRQATQALNVEFTSGGVATRRGTRRIVSGLYQQGGQARAATVKLVRGFADTGGFGFGFPMTAVGIVPTAGGDAATERLLVLSEGGGAIVDHERLHLAAPQFTNPDPSSRWDACMFQQSNRRRPDLVVCTDHADHANPTAHVYNRVAGRMSLNGVDRSVHPFHTVVVNPTPARDDDGDYSLMAGAPVRARFCRTHRGRLVLGHWWGLPWKGPPVDLPSVIWVSNLGDARGWCIENIIAPEGDTTPVRGLGQWRQKIAVFRESSVSLWWMTGPTPDVSVYRQVVSDKGCVAHGTILDDVAGMTLFLSHDGFHGFRGDASPVHLSAPIERTLRRRMWAQNPGGAFAVHHPWRDQVWLAMPDKGDAPDRVYVMDYSAGPGGGAPAWSEFEFQLAAWAQGVIPRRIGGLARSHDATALRGVTLQADFELDYDRFDTGGHRDNQGTGTELGYRTQWESGPVDFGKASVDRWRLLRPTLRPTGRHDVTVWWRRDGQRYDEDLLNSQSDTIPADPSGAGPGLGAFVLGTDRIGGAEDQIGRVDVHAGGVGRYGRFGIRTDDVAGRAFDLRAMEIDVIDKQSRR